MACVAPSEVVTPLVAAAFGLVAESIIGGEYLKDVGRAAFFPASLKDFQDISPGFGNVPLLIAFLKANHPKLSVTQLAFLSAAGLVKIADLMTFDPPRRTEFYEIKPNSPDGRLAGRTKVASIDALMTSLGLPYVPGTQYTPNKKILVYSGTPMGCKLDVFFHFQRIQPGLIVYDLCPEGDLACLGLKALLAVIAVIILALIIALAPEALPAIPELLPEVLPGLIPILA